MSLARILVIEDERMVRDALVRKLQTTGFTILEAGDGQEGLNLAQKEKPDLILLDLILPLMDGITVLEKLRADEATRPIPVIVLSNLSDDATVEESKKKGVYDYLIKTDWTLDDVIAKVKEVLKIK
jgi:CheY-like chemotaxis protein